MSESLCPACLFWEWSSEGNGHEMVSYWGFLDESASGCRRAKGKRRQCIRHEPSEREEEAMAAVHELFSSLDWKRALAWCADDDDMSHETVAGHGQRVPD